MARRQRCSFPSQRAPARRSNRRRFRRGRRSLQMRMRRRQSTSSKLSTVAVPCPGSCRTVATHRSVEYRGDNQQEVLLAGEHVDTQHRSNDHTGQESGNQLRRERGVEAAVAGVARNCARHRNHVEQKIRRCDLRSVGSEDARCAGTKRNAPDTPTGVVSAATTNAIAAPATSSNLPGFTEARRSV